VRAVLFDFDFTLVDSSAGILECFAFARARVGLPPACPEATRRTIGLTLAEALRVLHGVEDADLVARFRGAFLERAEAVMAASAVPLEAAAGTLAALRAAGLALAVCSTKHRGQIERILGRLALAQRFDAIVGAEDVARHKPEPDALLLALERLGVAPAQAVYVGDHRVDAEAAARAGVPFVAVLTGPSPREEFAGQPVRAFLGSLAELAGALGFAPAGGAS
jgi:phosphoglycolate phosphatase